MRCFIIRTRRFKRKNKAVTKKLCRKPRFRRIFLQIPKISFSFKHISNKTKIITLASITLIFALCIIAALTKNAKTNKSIAVFGHSDSDIIISEVLPSTQEPSSISELKKYISKATNKTPDEIVKSYGGVLKSIKKQTPSPTPALPDTTHTPLTPPKEKTIITKNLLRNETSYVVQTKTYNDIPLSFNDNTQVLIIHTHTTESYTPEELTSAPDNSRSIDETKNMLAIGAIIKTELEKSGIKVVHDKTVHDYPSYQGAYGRSLTTAKNHLKNNPNLQIILDIHRDAIVNDDGTKVKLVKDINNVTCAQVMIVCGTDAGGLSHDEWQKNLNFAIKLQEKADSKYPGLMRPINLRNERFNQHLTPASLILEIGSHGNTLTEAKNSAALIANAIAELIT